MKPKKLFINRTKKLYQKYGQDRKVAFQPETVTQVFSYKEARETVTALKRDAPEWEYYVSQNLVKNGGKKNDTKSWRSSSDKARNEKSDS